MSTKPSFAPLLERFFTQRLMQQRQVSPHTISSYRDTFRQLLKFIEQRLHKAPSQLMFEEINAPLIAAFLEHLEKDQGLSISPASRPESPPHWLCGARPLGKS
jgi:site-specific recombinase XerD